MAGSGRKTAGRIDGRAALWVGTACYLFSAVVWGMNIPLTAVLFRTFDPYFLAPVRVTLAALVLAAIAAATTRRVRFALGARVGRLALMSLAMAGFFSFYTIGLAFTHPVTAATVLAGAPVYAAITLRLATRVPLERGFWGAAALTLVGAGIAIWGRAHESGPGISIGGGEPLLALALGCWSLYSIASQRWFDARAPQLQRTCVALAGTAAWLAIVWLAVVSLGVVAPPAKAPDRTAITFLLMTGILSTALGGVTWNIGVERIGLAAGSVWQNTVPVFGVLISMLFGFIPTVEQVVGGTVVLAGVFYLQWNRARALRAVRIEEKRP